MLRWSDVEVAQCRYEDARRQARMDRLARLVEAGEARKPGLPARAMGWLGTRLVSWGSRLQREACLTRPASLRANAEQAKA